MAKRKKKLTRDVITPTIDLATAGAFVKTDDAGGPTFWKQILPEVDAFEYVDDDGDKHYLDFSRASNSELVEAYHDGAMDQLSFLLADKDNAHTMDPERWRATVTDVRLSEGDEQPGIYGKVVFGSKKLAKSVINNPALGVSARIRPADFTGKSGRKYTRKLVHVLGTLDPRATGMSAWTPAVDLSVYDSKHTVLDLSGTTYAEVTPVAKVKRDGKVITPKAFAEMTDDELTAAQFTEKEIASLVDAMPEDVLKAFIAASAEDGDEPDESDDNESDDDDDSDDDGEGDDDSNDDSNDDQDADAGDREPVGADMSNTRRDIDLANSRADEATRTARKALKKAAEAEAKEQRTAMLSKGVPPWAVDLAVPALVGDDDLVIDLSNHGGEKKVNASKIIRGLLEGMEGTIDLSDVDLGHGDAEGTDQYAEARSALDAIDI